MAETAADVLRALKIDPAHLERQIVPLSAVHPNPWNPNRMDERTYEAERESIRRFGFIDPCLVRPHPEFPGEWQLIDGEHRKRAAYDEGYEDVLIDSVGPISDVDAKTLTVTLNETRGEADVALLGQLLVEIEQAGGGEEWAKSLPYSQAELQHLLSVGRVEWDQFPAAPEDAGDEDGGEDGAHTVTLSFSEDELRRFQTFSEMIARERGTERVESVVLEALTALAEAL